MIALIVLIIFTGLLIPYTTRLQATTLNLGKNVGELILDVDKTKENIQAEAIKRKGKTNFVTNLKLSSLSKRGVQDIITPPLQSHRNVLLPLLIITVFILSLKITVWYWGLLIVVATLFFGSICGRFMPKENSLYFVNIIKKYLHRKMVLKTKKGNTEQAQFIKEIIRAIDFRIQMKDLGIFKNHDCL
ncbi:MAG: hypothetical protein K9M51_03810 [Candidatus Gracilibacteria bacterium]|nr:hypothetical protein [Candidatus Gracilibacteria bacterium]